MVNVFVSILKQKYKKSLNINLSKMYFYRGSRQKKNGFRVAMSQHYNLF